MERKNGVVLYEVTDHIATITLNRPEQRNALNREMSQALRAALVRFRDDQDLRVAILTGAGERAFSAGGDLKRMSQVTVEEGSETERRRRQFFYPEPETEPVEVWKPVIAAINGYCFAAGMNIVCQYTDIRIASENATFSYAEVRNVGVSGAGPALTMISRTIPLPIAMKWLLTGEVFNAQEAARWGFVNEVVPLPKLMPRAREMAQQLVAVPPMAVRAAKEAILRGLDMDIRNAMRWCSAMSTITWHTEDAKEGPKAFAEKRQPVWKGR